MASKALLIIFVAIATVTAQTFQYSRGWTNGKRAPHHTWSERNRKLEDIADNTIKRIAPWLVDNSVDSDSETKHLAARHMPHDGVASGIAASLGRISPCQMNKLKYILNGVSLDEEWLYVPCESDGAGNDAVTPRLKPEEKKKRNAEKLYEVFQY